MNQWLSAPLLLLAFASALIMNIETGSGTLVHEIVHPFMRANFPNCPAWFNEGLASLYEASAEKNGHIQGLINWRYKGLEKAIKEGKTISFQQLTALTAGEFYGGDSYSQHYGECILSVGRSLITWKDFFNTRILPESVQ